MVKVQLGETEFDCLNSVSDGGALCPVLDKDKKQTGRFVVHGSPKIGPGHQGWTAAVVFRLYATKLLNRTSADEYSITLRGKDACREYRVKVVSSAAADAARENPGKVVLLSDFRREARA